MDKPDLDLKYYLYEASVQNADYEIAFIRARYWDKNQQDPKILREDFCGTGLLCYSWVKEGEDFKAIGLDIDEIPISYGKKHHLPKLTEDEKSRVKIEMQDVTVSDQVQADVIVAFNFSYFIFKKRAQLLKYFKSVLNALNPGGLFFLDLFGGLETHQEIEDEIDYGEFIYYWDCDFFNVINNDVKFNIHYKLPNQKKRYEKVFTYDWRFWTISEIRDLLEEAGFANISVYWEEDGEDGEGNGVYYKATQEQNCDSWVVYVVAEKN